MLILVSMQPHSSVMFEKKQSTRQAEVEYSYLSCKKLKLSVSLTSLQLFCFLLAVLVSDTFFCRTPMNMFRPGGTATPMSSGDGGSF